MPAFAAHADEYGRIAVDCGANDRPTLDDSRPSLFYEICTVLDAKDKTKLEFNIEGSDFPSLTNTWSLERVNPGGITVHDAPKLLSRTMDLYSLYAQPTITEKLYHQNDSGLDMKEYMDRQIVNAINREFDKVCIRGSGTDRPKGLSAYTFHDSNTNIDTILRIRSGVANQPTYSSLLQTVFSLPINWRANASWLMHPDTLVLIRNMSTSGGVPVLETEHGQTKIDAKLLGYPVYTDMEVPTVTGGGVVAYFGDFKACYVGDGKIIRQWDEYSYKPLITYYVSAWRGFILPDCRAMRGVSFTVAP